MRQYYYTVASLPALRFDDEPFLDTPAFLGLCSVEVSAEDLQFLTEATIWLSREDSGSSVPGVSGQWYTALRDIQFQTAQIRAQSLGREGEKIPAVSGTDASLTERVRGIMNEENPLKTEFALLHRLWETAENLEAGHHFDRDKLFLYHLKLQIAHRRARIADREQGDADFDKQYTGVAESLMEIAR